MKTLATVILGLATACAAQAYAADAIVVHYDDLNVATPAGAAVLYKRITQAAKVVCPEYPAGDVRNIKISRPCNQEAVARAVASVHLPMLTAR